MFDVVQSFFQSCFFFYIISVLGLNQTVSEDNSRQIISRSVLQLKWRINRKKKDSPSVTFFFRGSPLFCVVFIKALCSIQWYNYFLSTQNSGSSNCGSRTRWNAAYRIVGRAWANDADVLHKSRSRNGMSDHVQRASTHPRSRQWQVSVLWLHRLISPHYIGDHSNG